MKVHEVPIYEEFYGLLDNELSDEDFESDVADEDIREMIVLALSLLQEFYLTVKYSSEYYVLTESFKRELDKFNTELKEQILVLFTDYADKIAVELDLKWNIPSDVVDTGLKLENVVDSAVDAVTSTLYYDLKDKATFYRDMAITTGLFALHSNFRRAVRKLTNTVNYNAQYLNKRITRSYDEFVYGQEALFYWRCAGVNTCAWCYAIEASSPLPLSMLPVDHPNGMCNIEPVFPDVYSEEYMDIVQG